MRPRPGQKIGLLGGSFDPPHLGHVHITRQALARFGLDRIWWLVSPGNPLKPVGPAAMERRISAAKRIMQHPRVTVTGLEAELGTKYTAATIDALRTRYPSVTFVWLMGADNLITFHKWGRWRDIIETVPVGILARPGDRMAARRSPAAALYRFAQMKGSKSLLLPNSRPPSWCFVNVPMVNVSSTAIRARGEWVR